MKLITVPTVSLASRIVAENTVDDDEDIDLPPLEEDDGGGSKGCDWEFDSCYEEGTYKLAPFFNTDDGQPEFYDLCLRHYVVWIEYIADVIGETISNRRFASGEDLENYVFGHIYTWAHAADAPKDAFPMPEVILRRYLNKAVDANLYRSEAYGDDFPDKPRLIGYNPQIEATLKKVIGDYLAAKGLTLVAGKTAGEGERDMNWVERIYHEAVDPILLSAGSTPKAVEQIEALDLSRFDV